ncbi:hypothetical protein KUCAC02_013549, partial [Chaenocephalus aceratus]
EEKEDTALLKNRDNWIKEEEEGRCQVSLDSVGLLTERPAASLFLPCSICLTFHPSQCSPAQTVNRQQPHSENWPQIARSLWATDSNWKPASSEVR